MLLHVTQDLHRLGTGYVFVSVAVMSNKPDFDLECFINYWKNNFKDFFKIVKRELITPSEELPQLKDRQIATFLLKKK